MTVKLSISLPDDVAAYLQGRGNVSAAITEAVRTRMSGVGIPELLEAMGRAGTDEQRFLWRQRWRKALRHTERPA